VLPVILWCCLAIRFSNLPGETLRWLAASLFGLWCLAAVVGLWAGKRSYRWLWISLLLVILWWSAIPASNDRSWMPEMARVPTVTRAGDRLTVQNLRNFDYRSEADFTERWEQRDYSLSKLESVDLIVSNWGILDVSHLMLSFGFQDGQQLAVSVESRREQGEPQTGLRALFKQYELLHILGTEEDLLRLRTSFRREDVWVYPLKTKGENLQNFLLSLIDRINGLAEQPEWYNMITQNCTTTLLPHRQRASLADLWDLRVLLNGSFDELAYELGSIDTELSFSEARDYFYVNQYTSQNAQPSGYSRRIRPWLGNS
jgi:hypothetical protein